MEIRTEVALDRSALDRLRARLDDARFGPPLGEGWSHGVSHAWLTELLADWQRYEPARLQTRLDRMEHRRVELDGLSIHLVQTPGVGPNPLPLVLTHGWPGSFLEYAELVPLLTDPATHGTDPDEAFTVVTPSLPGFGFSDTRPVALSSRETARLWRQMMNALGHEQFVAHGSDLGAGVTSWLARDHQDAVLGIHLATPGLALPRSVEASHEEQRFAREAADWNRREGGYMHEHSTKPATLAAALSDSPAGLAAWVGEKLVAWSSTRADGSPAMTRERMLETLTLYWATGTIASSLLPYWAFSRHPEAHLPPGDPAPTSTAISIFGGERVPFPKPPRELAERYYTVRGWREHKRGGHFPALAEPALLATDIRNAFASLRAR
ncbi:MAG TPA: alpha/beta fold hydrolase [Solirubrobacteraceae bacterium]|nr:alpha/beta fold hydrolase [Solirubrobacteraceae bacterium]